MSQLKYVYSHLSPTSHGSTCWGSIQANNLLDAKIKYLEKLKANTATSWQTDLLKAGSLVIITETGDGEPYRSIAFKVTTKTETITTHEATDF